MTQASGAATTLRARLAGLQPRSLGAMIALGVLGVVALSLAPTPLVSGTRETSIALLQLIGVLLLVGVLVLVVRWINSEPRGTLVLPFETSIASEGYTGKSIADALSAELARLASVHTSAYVGPPEGPFDPIDPASTAPLQSSSDGARSRRTNWSIKQKERRTPSRLSATRDRTGLARASDQVTSSLAAVNVGVAGTSVSIGQLLVLLKQLLSERDPELLITGSLQRFGKLHRLVARVHDAKRGRTYTWEARNTIEAQEQISELIHDIAVMIVRRIELSPEQRPRSWQGLKHYIPALASYRAFRSSRKIEELDAAAASCLEIAGVEPDYPHLIWLARELASACYDHGRLEPAARLYRQSIELASSLPDAQRPTILADSFNGLGACLASQGDPASAERCFRDAVRIHPANHVYWINLATVLAGRGWDVEAQGIIEQAHASGVLDQLEHAERGDVFARLGQTRRATEAYQRAIEANVEASYAHRRLGDLLDASDSPEALEHYRQAVTLHPNDPVAHNSLGLAYDAAGEPENAEREYESAIGLDPTAVAPRNNLGLLYVRINEIARAEREFRRAAEFREDPTPVFNLVRLYVGTGRRREAADAYRAVRESDDAASHSGLGYDFRNAGFYEESIDAFGRAIELESGAEAHLGLGGTYRRMRNWDDAVKAYENAIRLDPENALAHASLAASLQLAGRNSDAAAVRARAKALADAWMDVGNEYNVACLWALLGDADTALPHLKAALEGDKLDPTYAKRDVDFELIRDDPRFEALLEPPATAGAPPSASPNGPAPA